MDKPAEDRPRASFSAQANALVRKNLSFQKRKWGSNACLLMSPFLVCTMLYLLQEIINAQLNSRSFHCGCKCLSCCDWLALRAPNGTTSYVYQCYDATDERPCSPYSTCSAYDDNECGYLFSTADQVGFCEVRRPPLWPALVQVPHQAQRGEKYPEFMPDGVNGGGNTQPPPPPVAAGENSSPPAAPPLPANVLYTGQDPVMAAQLMSGMWTRGVSITDAAAAAYMRAQAGGMDLPTSTENQTIASEQDFVDAAGSLTRGLYEFGLVMGTSAFTSVTMLMEPAFVASTTSAAAVGGAVTRPPLYFLQPDCAMLSDTDRNTLGRIGEAITNMTGFPVECVTVEPTFMQSAADMNDLVYCGWLSSGCVVRNGVLQEVPPQVAARASNPVAEHVGALYDWHNTDSNNLRVSVWVNNSNVARDPGVPDIQRWGQPVNLAANAYLRNAAGANASARLAGIKDMPKGATRLSLDFSSLLGPLFMMWFAQLLLPVNVYALVMEKERHLRIMMRMQGLREGAYYAVQYAWMVALYSVFMAIFVGFGSAIGLKIFTLNSYSVQFVFYALWGNLLASFSFYFSAWQREARPAVLLAVIYVIVTGFVANLVLVQYVEQGPALVANLLMALPAFGLFRGLYELAQYAFLAERTGGDGLTWEKLLDPDCGMLQIWFFFIIEWLMFPLLAFYIEQVTGAGTGVKRHPLFFLGVRHSDATTQEKKRRWWQRKEKKDLKSKEGQQQQQQGDMSTTAASEQQYADPSGGNTNSGGNGSTAPPSPSNREEVQSPLDYYYGSATAMGAASPHLPMEGLEPLATDAVASAQQLTDPSHLVASKVTSVQRKITSVKLNVSPEKAPLGWNKEGDEDDAPDVAAERTRVDAMFQNWASVGGPKAGIPPPCAILLHKLRKVYPSRGHGSTPKVAVHSLSLGIERCECFGLLGPNGAGKTTTIRMMEGFLDPTSGAAVIEGLSIPGDIDSVYSLTGACPQHDLLWEGLTGREHLLFYGRVKGLAQEALRRGVDAGLRRVNLLSVGDDLVGSYSGGMKRRLSVAIALIGDPKVVYLDEPSTGLDPSSRRLLWDVIRDARRKAAVVLTTHSMEEAEALCDRLGIFVGGRLECLGNPKDLTARFGGYLSFTLTTPPHQEAAAAAVVRGMSPGARSVYSLGGTQKFELPLSEVGVESVFRRMEEVKLRRELEVLDWGVSNATLEEVFIKITRDAGVKMSAFT